MPKITVHGGPSNSGDPHVRPGEEGEYKWPGNSSSTSSDRAETNIEPSENDRQKPAPTTESLSEQDQTENSSASQTDGNGPETPAHSASKKEWVKFVRSQGFESEGANAEDYTRNQLREWWESDEE